MRLRTSPSLTNWLKMRPFQQMDKNPCQMIKRLPPSKSLVSPIKPKHFTILKDSCFIKSKWKENAPEPMQVVIEIVLALQIPLIIPMLVMISTILSCLSNGRNRYKTLAWETLSKCQEFCRLSSTYSDTKGKIFANLVQTSWISRKPKNRSMIACSNLWQVTILSDQTSRIIKPTKSCLS